MSGSTSVGVTNRDAVPGRQVMVLLAAWIVLRGVSFGASQDSLIAVAERRETPVQITADFAQRLSQGSERVYVLRGRCRVQQPPTMAEADRAVVWQRSLPDRQELTIYLEGHARYVHPTGTVSQPSLLLQFQTTGGIEVKSQWPVVQSRRDDDPLLARALRQRRLANRADLQPTQLSVAPASNESGSTTFQVPTAKRGYRRIRISPRTVIPFNVYSEKSTATTPPEQVTVLTGGVNLIIEGVGEYGTIDLSADRMVIWTRVGDAERFEQGLETLQPADAPFQVYMEGNIEIRQGRNLVKAERAFYDAREQRGLLLDAELKAWVEPLRTNVRVRAERIRQLSEKSFHAQNAWVTTSPYGKPGYRLQASDIFLEPRYLTPWGAWGEPFPAGSDTWTHEVPWLTSLNNTFFLDDVPLAYVPYLSGPAEDPHIPLRSVSVGHDGIFGFQLETVWNAFQLFSLNAPPGVDWNLLLDYRTERGPAAGSTVRYEAREPLGLPGKVQGELLGYYVYDTDEDNLGADRRRLPPESYHRGRVLLRHRHQLPFGTTLLGEVGFVSDRNFLEQYYEEEFDEGKDNETLLFLRQHWSNVSWSVLVRPQVNDFENTTEWFPKVDFYVLSEPILGGLLTWTAHGSAGYARLRSAAAPPDPVADPFQLLPWYASDAEGGVFTTRHELDLPLLAGPLQLVPFVWGELDSWGEDLTGDDLSRAVASAGVRGSLMLWRVYPFVHSEVFNLNGLAHKMVFDAEYAWVDASQSVFQVPLYNEFDDNAQERFRERLLVNTYGGIIPSIFDPRFYAVRVGAGMPVSTPYPELVDDQQVLRVAWRHRLQTKVGPPERLRTKDWMTLDLEASYFPRPGRDNFGEPFGLLGARYNWFVGDRTQFIANAYYDLFDGGPELWDVGLLSYRPTRGSLYIGFRQIKARNIDSQILTASASYAMNEKWIATFATAYDVAENRNRGQSVTLTRVGLDFLVHIGASWDESKGSAGVSVSVEPKIGPFDASSRQLRSLLQAP